MAVDQPAWEHREGAPDEGATIAPFREHLRVLVHRKWIVIAALVLVPAAAVAIALQKTPTYRGSAEVLLSPLNLATGLTGIPDPTASDPARTTVTQAGLARVPAIAQRTLRAAGLRDRTVKDFLAASSVETTTDSDLLRFVVTDPDPQLASRLASTYATQYTAYRRQLDTAAIDRARADLEKRIAAEKKATGGKGSLYASLVANDEKLRTMEAILSSNASVVRAGEAPVKVGSSLARMLLFGTVLGIVLGVGLAFAVEAADTRVRTVEEVGRRLALPLLARLPERRRRRARRGGSEEATGPDRTLVMLESPSGVGAEGYRILRANLDFLNGEHRARCIMATSALEREGKSEAIANLALAFARVGRRVVLVDLDLRRPTLHRLFDAGDRPGIAEVAAGSAQLDDALVSIPLADGGEPSEPRNGRFAGPGTLELLPAGLARLDAGEFAGMSALGAVIRKLRQRADLVFVDSPALLRVGDSIALSAHVDALLVVVRLKATRRPVLRELRRVLDTCPATKLGYVVTHAETALGYGYTEPGRVRRHVGLRARLRRWTAVAWQRARDLKWA